MQASKYIQQWKVKLTSGGTKTVSLTLRGKFLCNCWAATNERKECNHIRAVKEGRGRPVMPEMARMLTVCAEVAPHPTLERALAVPFVPEGDEHQDFRMTVMYDLLMSGISWRSIEAEYRPNCSGQDVFRFIRERGKRTIRDQASFVTDVGYTRYLDVPLEG